MANDYVKEHIVYFYMRVCPVILEEQNSRTCFIIARFPSSHSTNTQEEDSIVCEAVTVDNNVLSHITHGDCYNDNYEVHLSCLFCDGVQSAAIHCFFC